ncbi:unnamed protein product [Darwinula stevensoni]|uniref:Uncharacterized protein n=1 Tax=Darwinula stevensoni TaxID=69355 RepID=A0A7R9AG12_9CRUS|nr:unnamed protein product [Darwinula stevensoni]CAG0903832.1 unnamed protein product [Darwinula stevensoni]
MKTGVPSRIHLSLQRACEHEEPPCFATRHLESTPGTLGKTRMDWNGGSPGSFSSPISKVLTVYINIYMHIIEIFGDRLLQVKQGVRGSRIMDHWQERHFVPHDYSSFSYQQNRLDVNEHPTSQASFRSYLQLTLPFSQRLQFQ